jgi:type III secretion protein Q
MDNQALYDEELETSLDDEYEASSQGYDDEPEHALAENDWQAEDDQHTPFDSGAIPPLDPLDQLPMALTLRCGTLELTLGELRCIGEGSVLQVAGISPGHATLCHGERIVAEGELVDVDGRLGLQITRMASPA